MAAVRLPLALAVLLVAAVGAAAAEEPRRELPAAPFATAGTDAPVAPDELATLTAAALPRLTWCPRLAAAAAAWSAVADQLGTTELPPGVADVALRWAGLPDPWAVVTTLSSSRPSPAEALRQLAEVAAAAPRPYSHLGLASTTRSEVDGRWRWTAFLVCRELAVEPLPIRMEPGQPSVLTFSLAPGLDRPTVTALLPDGEVRRLGPVPVEARWMAGLPAVNGTGTLWLHVLADDADGHGVRGLMRLEVGREPSWSWSAPPPGAAGEEPRAEAAEALLLALVNEDRTRHGLAAVTFDPRLAAIARAHSRDMAETGFFAHHSPRYGGLAERLDVALYPARHACENIASSGSVASAQASLIESPSHRANLLDPEVTHVGFGVVPVAGPAGGRTLVTQIFSRPTRQLEARDLEREVRRLLEARRPQASADAGEEDDELDRVARDLARRAAAGERLGPVALPPGRTGRLLLELVEVEDVADLYLPAAALSPSLRAFGLGVACSGTPPLQRHHVAFVLAE